MRTTAEQRQRIEQRICAAMDRLLGASDQSGNKCDVKTLAIESGVSRAALYSTYVHLKEEFERRRELARQEGKLIDPRQAHIERLKEQVSTLQGRVAKRDSVIDELKNFQIMALSRLTAQHDEILRLRAALSTHSNVVGIAARTKACKQSS